VVMESSCCFSVFCKLCVLRLQNMGNVDCPSCSKPVRKFQLNVPLQRLVDQQGTKCRFETLGCRKVVEFKDVDEHQASCEFALVECSNRCGRSLISKELEDHQRDNCPLRSIQCCRGKCDKTMPFVLLEIHNNSECKYVKVKCPNCFKEVKRKNLKNHIEFKCPESLVGCPYGECGCCDKMPRKQLLLHLDKSTKLHLQLVLKRVNKQQKQIEDLTAELKQVRSDRENKCLDIKDLLPPNFTKQLCKWEKCSFNLMYLWFALLVIIQWTACMAAPTEEAVPSQYLLSIVIYLILMGYYYYIHTMPDVSWYVKAGVTVYFLIVWLVLSSIIGY